MADFSVYYHMISYEYEPASIVERLHWRIRTDRATGDRYV